MLAPGGRAEYRFASMAPRLPLYLLSQLRTLSCRAQSIELGIGALETGDAVLIY